MTTRDLDDIRGAVAGRELYDAKAIPVGIEPQSFGIDRDRVRHFIGRQIRQVALVVPDGHVALSPFALPLHRIDRKCLTVR